MLITGLYSKDRRTTEIFQAGDLIGIYKDFRDWAAARGETIRATTSFLLAGTTTPSGDVIRELQNSTQTDCWNGKAYTPTNQLTPGRTKYGANNNVRIFRIAEYY